MLNPDRPFTRSEALAAGLTPRMVGGARFRRIFRGVYIAASVPQTHEERILGALLLHTDGAWASHLSAAQLCGVVVPKTSDVHISVRFAEDRRWQPGIKPHVAPMHTKVGQCRGLPVSDPVRMFVELASVLDLVDLVVAGDSLIKVFHMTADQLRAKLDETRDYWSPAARHAATFVRDDVDSPMESRLRMLLVLAGLPEPEVNLAVRDERGDVVVRFDLAYRIARVVVEYDGRQHVEVIENWESDLDRREYLDDQAWRVIKVIARGIYVEPERTVERVWRVLRRRGLLLPPPRDDWRPFFRGRRAA